MFAATVIASQRVGAKRRPMTGSAKQSMLFCRSESRIASSQGRLAMTMGRSKKARG
jgi:hypothetical protein